MPTPAELRALSKVGKEEKDKREAEHRKQEERKWREQRMEQAAKDHAEAQRQIININSSLEWSAKGGNTSLRLHKVYTDNLEHLESVDRIIADHFKKEGFEVDIETCDGPEIRFEPDYIHYLRISW